MDAGHAGNARDAVEQQVLIGVHVAYDNLELIIGVLPGNQQTFQDFRIFADLRLEVGEAFRGVLVHRDMDQGHQR